LASAVGYELGIAFIPAAIVLLYYRIKKQEVSSARVIVVLTSWIFVTNLFTISRSKPELTEADLPLIAKEAAGLAPTTNPNDTARTVLRDYFKELIAQNKSYFSKVDTINFDSLYTPRSYLEQEEAKRIITQVDATLEIEQSQVVALDNIADRYEMKLKSLGWSEDYKRKFLVGFEKGREKKRALQKPMLDAEKNWLNCIRGLYILVLVNQQYFHRSGENITISNAEVRKEFNQQIDRANELSQQYTEAKRIYQQSESEGLNKLGVTAQEFGEKR
jgi:hypothetical protein